MAVFFYVIKSNKECKKGISYLNELSNLTVLYVLPFQTILSLYTLRNHIGASQKELLVDQEL